MRGDLIVLGDLFFLSPHAAEGLCVGTSGARARSAKKRDNEEDALHGNVVLKRKAKRKNRSQTSFATTTLASRRLAINEYEAKNSAFPMVGIECKCQNLLLTLSHV